MAGQWQVGDPPVLVVLNAPMATVPESTKSFLTQKLTARARIAWPGLAGLDVRYRSQFAYLDGELTDGENIKLMRLRYAGSAGPWGFAL
ncbi:hypothetical protein [Streptomyces sp. NBC_01092]|uniref:hypothetical protein n=1 Tax=Streptomyces sp. NBC_01092 TaxID=2903748 RepID=UPI00386391DC|nr:hypothetical protein OG254_01020 [Streptomyces sp. NBC_01092]